MKLGVFDSGLGGLIITKAIRESLPKVDLFYYGDTLHLPYGNRSHEAIYKYTKASMTYMFGNDCQLIVMACNTASAAALRRLQQNWLGDAWPGRNIIGVVVPTLETALDLGHNKLGLIGTNYIVESEVYKEELQKLNPGISLQSIATPLLVPLIENNGEPWLKDVLKSYLDQLKGIECLLLGCTHYASLKNHVRELMGENITVLSQDELIPPKLMDYLGRHPEHNDKIGKNGNSEFWVSDLTTGYLNAAQHLYGGDIQIQQAVKP